MTTPHSLPFSNLPQGIVNTNRHSGSSQLPLPSSLHTNSAQRQALGRPSASETMPPSPRSPSSPSATVFSSSVNTPPMQPQSQFSTHHSSTHAGGIQPSASFFRPSRPNQQSRPNSEASLQGRAASPASHIPDAEVFQLTHVENVQSNGSGEPSANLNDTRESFDQQRQFSSRKRTKQSREPLLPIDSGTNSSSVRPSIMHGISERSMHSLSNIPGSPMTPGRRMRASLEKVFTLKRGMSFDSLRKSTSSRHLATSDEGPSSFEGKLRDEENGNINIYPPSTSNRHPASPRNFAQSLDVTVSQRSQLHSPDPSYNPAPPVNNPPLAYIPLLDPNTNKQMRKYQQHGSRNRFFFQGRLLTGGDSPWAFIACLSVLVTIAGVWFATTCVWWWHNVTPAVPMIGAYMTLLVISTMLATAFRDPGILPRSLDLDPPYPTTSPSDGGIRAPMPRDLKVRTDVVRVKYCPTCKTYRPPRSSHCKMCDNCVDGCDHHCQWVNNCIGRRNYTTFFSLLFTATVTLILVICTSALHFYFLVRRQGVSFRSALRTGAGSAVVFCLSIAVIWPVAALLAYHLRLLFLNVTTIEQIRNQAHKSLVPGPAPPNPFSHGTWRRNLMTVLCRPVAPSWLNPHGVATEDKRELNPGFVEGWDRDDD